MIHHCAIIGKLGYQPFIDANDVNAKLLANYSNSEYGLSFTIGVNVAAYLSPPTISSKSWQSRKPSVLIREIARSITELHH
jgi:hypothetical protein